MMKIIIQNMKTGQYLVTPKKWTSDLSKACIFKTSAEAVLFATQQHLTDVQVIIRFNGSDLDVSFPLKDTEK